MIKIGNNCKITNHVEFITHDGGAHVIRNLKNDSSIDIFKGKIVLGNNVFVGNRSCIMPGVKIGNNVIIGYGSIVTKDVPDNCVIAGCPARIIKSIDKYLIDNSCNFVDTKNMRYSDKKRYLMQKYEE